MHIYLWETYLKDNLEEEIVGSENGSLLDSDEYSLDDIETNRITIKTKKQYLIW